VRIRTGRKSPGCVMCCGKPAFAPNRRRAQLVECVMVMMMMYSMYSRYR
jgi:hypothetical protein